MKPEHIVVIKDKVYTEKQILEALEFSDLYKNEEFGKRYKSLKEKADKCLMYKERCEKYEPLLNGYEQEIKQLKEQMSIHGVSKTLKKLQKVRELVKKMDKFDGDDLEWAWDSTRNEFHGILKDEEKGLINNLEDIEILVKNLNDIQLGNIVGCRSEKPFGLIIYGDMDKEQAEALKKQILENQEKAEKWDEYKEIQTFQHEQCKKLEQENKSMFSSNIAYAKSNDNLTQQNKELKEVVNAYNESELTKEIKQLKEEIENDHKPARESLARQLGSALADVYTNKETLQKVRERWNQINVDTDDAGDCVTMCITLKEILKEDEGVRKRIPTGVDIDSG